MAIRKSLTDEGCHRTHLPKTGLDRLRTFAIKFVRTLWEDHGIQVKRANALMPQSART